MSLPRSPTSRVRYLLLEAWVLCTVLCPYPALGSVQGRGPDMQRGVWSSGAVRGVISEVQRVLGKEGSGACSSEAVLFL